MKAAVCGTSGYTGLILLRLLTGHPHIHNIIPVSSSREGKHVRSIDPGIGEDIVEKTSLTGGLCVSIEKAAAMSPDVVFGALPHLKSAELLSPFFAKSVVIDLSADFRIKNPSVFEKSYGSPPPKPHLLHDAVYGLSEWYREDVVKADIIANPGCYPTATLLPLLPLLKEGIAGGLCLVTAISGISGAGKKVKENLLFCERSENTGAYSPGKSHRHTSEIQQEADTAMPGTEVLFTPHLAPLKRGMVITTAIPCIGEVSDEDIGGVYSRYYANAPFINIRPDIPQSRDVWGSNRCDISWQREGNVLLIFSAIDNLIKGASGQAVQNMNIRFGFEEISGLSVHNEI
ncbi:MAG: N-acetyl-gamma-glutamyl-phosphate reductase [Spirochaetales bacterium]|nr:N-acetyl-gamma-glutamyl-phosphate reductase [Spirochaetales bacterium]